MSRGKYCRRKCNAKSAYFVNHQSQDMRGYDVDYRGGKNSSYHIEEPFGSCSIESIAIKKTTLEDFISTTDGEKLRRIAMSQTQEAKQEACSSPKEEILRNCTHEKNEYVEIESSKSKHKWLVGLGVAALGAVGIVLAFRI